MAWGLLLAKVFEKIEFGEIWKYDDKNYGISFVNSKKQFRIFTDTNITDLITKAWKDAYETEHGDQES